MSELLKLIKSRRSIRKFLPDKVDDEILEKIVEAGRWAPTGGNSQSVHFTIITNQEMLNKLRDAVKNAFASMEIKEDMYGSIKNSIRQSINGHYVYDYNAPVLIILSNKKDYPNALADCACAIENMMLEATSLNIGSCYINQLHWLDNNEKIRNILETCGILSDETICASLALGKHEMTLSNIKRKGMKVTWIK